MKKILFHMVRMLTVPLALMIAAWEQTDLTKIEKAPRKDFSSVRFTSPPRSSSAT